MEKIKNNKRIIGGVLCFVFGIACSLTGLYFYHKQYLCYEYTPLLFILAVVVCLGNALLSLGFGISKNKDKKSKIKNSVISAVVTAVVLVGLMLVINLIAGKGGLKLVGLVVPVNLTFIITVALTMLCVFAIFSKKTVKSIAVIVVLIGFIVGSYSYIGTHINEILYGDYIAPEPTLSLYKGMEADDEMIKGDFYVSTKGNDNNNGTKNAPFLTIEKAIEAVRNTDKTDRSGITVCIESGEYCVSSIEFTKEDSGTKECPITYCAYNGEVVINGGKNIDASLFASVTDEKVLSQLSDDAKKNVFFVDLTKFGLDKDDWGKLYPVGKYGTQANYDGDTEGPVPCNLYFNGNSLTTARYPNEGFLNTVDIIREGQGEESSTSNHAKMEGWENLRNPETTIFTVDEETADRLNSYASLENVWLWTALIYEWADTTVPLKSFDYNTKAVEPAFVSKYGAVPGSTYYIFNVLEELDVPGEWYLDRESGKLYIYPPEKMDDARITISLSSKDLITVTDAEYLNFYGLTISGTRGNGVVINSNNVTVKNCLISELSGIGAMVDGYCNNIYNCEFTHIGGAAVDIKGGDREALKAGENRVENCLIHDYSEVSVTEGPGVNLYGVGNICAHNEFYNAPQQAVFYGGNNNIIEYNNIHDVALISNDCGAIYTGRRWDYTGNIIRYNALYNLGDSDHYPYGIYFDDGASGQTAYGNIIVNCKSSAFLIGGGRDNNVYNNIMVNCDSPFNYDDRSIDGAINKDSWFEHSREGADMYQYLMESPWQSEVWKEAYPYMADWTIDYSDYENPKFIPNPSDSRINGNIVVCYKNGIGSIVENVYKYSDISGNEIYGIGDMKKLFVDAENGNYNIKDIDKLRESIPDFENIPFEKIGRVAK